MRPRSLSGELSSLRAATDQSWLPVVDCPLFVRVLVRTGPNQNRGHVQNRPGFWAVNWEESVLLPPLAGLENR